MTEWTTAAAILARSARSSSPPQDDLDYAELCAGAVNAGIDDVLVDVIAEGTVTGTEPELLWLASMAGRRGVQAARGRVRADRVRRPAGGGDPGRSRLPRGSAADPRAVRDAGDRVSRLMSSRTAIVGALEAGGVNAATTGKFSAPCVLVEAGRSVGRASTSASAVAGSLAGG